MFNNVAQSKPGNRGMKWEDGLHRVVVEGCKHKSGIGKQSGNEYDAYEVEVRDIVKNRYKKVWVFYIQPGSHSELSMPDFAKQTLLSTCQTLGLLAQDMDGNTVMAHPSDESVRADMIGVECALEVTTGKKGQEYNTFYDKSELDDLPTPEAKEQSTLNAVSEFGAQVL